MFSSIGIPHGFCFLWNPGLLWLHVISDSLIALAYFLIPIVLLRIVHRRKDIPYNGILLCFGAFIVCCGITHIFEVVTLWRPVYWISGTMKAITAAISLTTFFVLIRLAPAIEALPSAKHLAMVNQQLSDVLESMTACVFALDRNWAIIYLNGNARQRLRVTGEVVGKTMFEAFPGQKPETLAVLREAMMTRKTTEFESYYEPLDLYTTVSASPWGDGGMTVFFNDISEQKKLQRELDAERELRERRIEALAHMAGGLAHEISNPLGIIHARASDLAELLENGQTLEPALIASTCASIVKTSDRAIRILSGLRMFARDGHTDPLGPASVATIVAEAVELVQQRYATHGIALTVTQPDEPLWITCREVQIGQILLNLLNNAFDAISSLPATDADRRWVRLAVSATSDGVTIDVVDGGPGVPVDHRAHLMKPFFTTKPVGAGIGIGLSLSQAIAHDHGGSLQLHADAPTCFRLTLPRATRAGESVAA